MALSPEQEQFLEGHPAAAMITTTREGVAKVARVAVAPVDGQLWSSGTKSRVRTRRLRRDPRCTLFAFDPGFAWLALETTVTILEGPEAPAQNLALFRRMQKRPTGPLAWFGRDLDEEQFLQTMVDEGRLVYQFDVHRTYGLG
ncbi:MAG: pyridoxamine 5'-phosphate oxidase family protein [Acidimicrobiales bacterium]|nr:pyridoxamine 5'-phosphate oxidase family protein [Acidimicrobiales bacterium]